MLLGRTLMWGILAGLLAGCTGDKLVRTTSLLDRIRPFQGAAADDVLQLDVALLECPVGNAYINQDLWLQVDEQVVPLERKAVLEENGFRLGQVGGIPPAGLQSLLTSEKHCLNPRRQFLHAGKPTLLGLGPAIQTCQILVTQNSLSAPVELKQAECGLNVTSFATTDSTVKLQFTPQIRHGAMKRGFEPSSDQVGWVFKEERETQSYSSLSWDVQLAPNQYVVIGGRMDRPGSLGCQSFVRRDEPAPVQRLLVIRASKFSGRGTSNSATESSKDESISFRTPPIAQQASSQ
jgi:hypothetical protein